ncbi:MAG: hypothetical protein LBO05_09840 [Deltaproteobacteria bacterium]|nr:hypothetical protein [Deltaproteobacteria bacterium]
MTVANVRSSQILVILLLALGFLLVVPNAPARADAPLDLAELARRGLGEKSREIVVTQTLARRGRPPLEIDFVMELVDYGGDDLARTYLVMDARTNRLRRAPVPPESMRKMMDASLPPREIMNLLVSAERSQNSDQAARPGQTPARTSPRAATGAAAASSAAPLAVAGSGAGRARTAPTGAHLTASSTFDGRTGIVETDLMGGQAPLPAAPPAALETMSPTRARAENQTQARARALAPASDVAADVAAAEGWPAPPAAQEWPAAAPAAQEWPDPPAAEEWPAAASAAQWPEPPAGAPRPLYRPDERAGYPGVAEAALREDKAPRPNDLRNVPQVLQPGQKADPARPMPVLPGPYWTRQPKGRGERFMGVTDQVKPDGHRVEVHTNARSGRLGQQVLGRESGRKVVRHYSMSPELALEGPDALPSAYSEPPYGSGENRSQASDYDRYPPAAQAYPEYDDYPEYPDYPEYQN